MSDKQTVRNILLALGVGDFNSTMSIPMMFMSPRETDPSMVQVIVVVECLQEALMQMGALNVQPTGELDDATAAALDHLMGPDWLNRPYYQTLEAVVRAERSGWRFPVPTVARPEPVGGTFDFLPAVPGGILTYGLGAFLLYRWMKKRKR